PFDDFSYEQSGKVIRFTSGGDQFLFDLARSELRKLIVPKTVGPLNQGTQQAGTFSPDFNYYAFIRDYDNLYLADTRTGKEERLTTGTSEDNLIGFLGVDEWYVWSPDSRRICYVKADQRALYKYPLLRDLDRHATVDYLRYPFTTDPNPLLELYVMDIGTKAQVKIATGTVEEPFLRDITWLNDGSEVTFQQVNQWDSRLELKAADAATGRVRTLLVDEDSTFLDPLHNFRQLSDGKRFTWSSERTGWRHIYLYDRQGKQLRQLTSGEWVTGAIDEIDEAGGWVYFEGATNFGLEQHFFRVKLDGTGLTKLTPEAGAHRVSIDPSAKFFLDRASSLSAPLSVTMRSADGKLLRQLGTTDVSKVAQLGLVQPELLTLKAADGVTPMHGILYKPADFDPSKRYPMVVAIYGGPHTKAIRDTYHTTDFEAALSQLGFLVAQFDGRGTIDRGKRWQAGSYLRLGQTDVDDQAAAVRQLRTRPYLDSTRVGVTGISHGGFMTIMMMLRYPDVYQVGAAGAPITDVRNGPRQYIGRMMRTPQANPDGYAQADLVARAKDLKGRLLIYHGTNDQNAVIGNTMQFVRKAIDAGRPVDMMIYPGGVHVLEGRDAVHGRKTMVSYFLEHLKPEGWEKSREALW
ncbi:MAG: DPP IV N-terminal domain-containing protein, partial [Gemmatimonadota bacterium]